MFPQLTDRNLILTGHTGRNPLAIGRTVAAQLRLPFVDYGQRFEAVAGMNADAVRATYGEARQRTLENQLIDEFALYRATVIHIRGSALAQSDYYTRLTQTGVPILLFASLDAVLARLHLTMGLRYHVPREREIVLGELRREWAVHTLHGLHRVDISYLSDEDAAAAAVALWREQTGAL